ncbi:MAG: hypothetical protein II996_01455 [Oscillospiraceae bacterium]|nr:hypothetical protein [Oscillospiraceae bacterium]MBQ4544221.1 hypothetical protein [Oscillospiraceae bacterium]
MAVQDKRKCVEKITEENIETVSEYEVLSAMLYGSITPEEKRELVAHRLLDEFGTIAHIIDAPLHKLLKIQGMGIVGATFLKLIPSFFRKYRQSKWPEHPVFKDYRYAARYMHDRLTGYETEVVVVMCLDSSGKMLSCKKIFEGTVNSADICLRKIMDFAITSDAKKVIIGHNHIYGSAMPSNADYDTTQIIAGVLKNARILLEDHVVSTYKEYRSFREIGFITE